MIFGLFTFYLTFSRSSLSLFQKFFNRYDVFIIFKDLTSLKCLFSYFITIPFIWNSLYSNMPHKSLANFPFDDIKSKLK